MQNLSMDFTILYNTNNTTRLLPPPPPLPVFGFAFLWYPLTTLQPHLYKGTAGIHATAAAAPAPKKVKPHS